MTLTRVLNKDFEGNHIHEVQVNILLKYMSFCH